MEFLELAGQNLLSPTILFFVLGVFAGVVKSDLNVPDQISRYLSIYLMMAIGFKGGVAIAQTPEINAEVIYTVISGLAVGFVIPFIAFWFLKLTTHLDRTTAAAVAAHYGSISMVTFVTAASFLNTNQIIYAGFIIGVLALMEAPAIVSGLFIAHKSAGRSNDQTSHNRAPKSLLLKEILTNGAIMLLVGAFFIGWASGTEGLKKMEGFLVVPFEGVLALFLLDMGLLVAKQVHHLKSFTFRLFLFGIYMPLIGAILGLALSWCIGLDVGTGLLFTVLCASASYIAVPAAMRLALPQAKAAIYLPLSLAITFPFNIVFGIPLYYSLASRILVTG